MAGVDVIATAMNGANAQFIAQLYAKWISAPDSVDPDFAALFAALDDEAKSVLTDASGASWAPQPNVFDGAFDAAPALTGKPAKAADSPSAAETRAATLDSIRALMMVRVYRVRGHLEAQLDPLGLRQPGHHVELDPASYGFGPDDFDRPIFIDGVLGRDTATVREILAVLRASYCGQIGVEFMHIQDPAQKSWIQQRIEGAPWLGAFKPEQKATILRQLTEADSFENFCQRRYVGTKRFGLEGGESTIPALHTIIETAADNGVKEIAIGMPHRGRLNTLVNIVKKPLIALFSEFGGASAKPEDVEGSGDVKYHLGTSTDIVVNGNPVHLSLQPNPSHLEAVDPVVVGKIRARQDMSGDTKTRRGAMGILMHGDAAFAGQGLVYETLAMSQLIGYRTGGTIHLVVNNQIGFTTVPAHAFSGLYCTDVAKAIQSPILHVNGDNPEAVVFAARLATEFRMQFGVDVVIDLVCYRRHGHNENEEPAFTQPIMYKAIKAMKTTRTLYAETLAHEGSVSAEQAKAMVDDYAKTLEDAYQGAQAFKVNKADWLEGHWSGLNQATEEDEQEEQATAAPLEQLREVGFAIAKAPANFEINSKILRQLDAKKQAVETGEGIDWATGEALAFGTLLLDGNRVRLSGEDCQRGTFSQRHAVLIDQANQNEYTLLNNMPSPA
jgi:2-oxoglutarate dehydrogenase E1 component